MQVRLRNPDREVEVAGPRTVDELLEQLEIDRTLVAVRGGGVTGGTVRRGDRPGEPTVLWR